MIRVYLIHRKEEERRERIKQLNAVGYEVVSDLPSGPSFAKQVEEQTPDVILIDLSRLPSQGRDLGVTMRSRKGTRSIPILFLEGTTEKVEPIRKLLPDAVYTTWNDVLPEIKTALDSKGKEFTAHHSVFAAYAGKPLAEKLGIKPGFRVSLNHAPEEIAQEIGALRSGTLLVMTYDPKADLYLWFLRSEEELI
jgi:CheY-like chemotaxis protein